MGQDFKDALYTYLGGDVEDTLEQTEANQNVLKSSFSGGDFPAEDSEVEFDPVPFMTWGDTVNKNLRMCHPDYGTSILSDEEEWLGLLFGDELQKMWIFRNDSMDGWVVSVEEDTVLGFKGGDIYTTGGVEVGSWTTGVGIHSHKWGEDSLGSDFKLYDSNGDLTTVSPVTRVTPYGIKVLNTLDYKWVDEMYTSKEDGGGSSIWRPQALVGTMQYINT